MRTINPHALLIVCIECKFWEIPELGATLLSANFDLFVSVDMGSLEITSVPFGEIFSFFKLATRTSLKLFYVYY